MLVFAGGSNDFAWQRLGVWDVDRWVDLDDDAVVDAPTPDDGVSVTSIELSTVVDDVGVALSDYSCVDGPLHVGIIPDITLPESQFGWGFGALAVDADWPLQPRELRTAGLDEEVYRLAGEQLLADRSGIDPSDGEIDQVIHVDLDGNGSEEVLVSFRHLPDRPVDAELGHFSVVYLRQVAEDGGDSDDLVFEYLVPDSPDYPAPGRAWVSAIADLNGDGTMEVALRREYWESHTIEVFEFRDRRLVPVMAGSCGV